MQLDERLHTAWRERTRDPRGAYALGAELLDEARAVGDHRAIASALRLMAWSAIASSDFQSARAHLLESLEHSRSCDDRRGEALALSLLGTTLYRLSALDEARGMYEESIAVARAVGDRQTEAAALNGLGVIRSDAGDYTAAMECHREALGIAVATGSREEESQSLLCIGNAHESRAEYREALAGYRRALDIAEAIGHVQLQAYATGNIGLAYERLGDITMALTYELRSLDLKESLGDVWGAGVSLNNIGLIYKTLGNYARALDYLLRALESAKRIGDRSGEMIALHNIGQVYETLGERAHMLDHYQRMLSIAVEIGERRGEAFALGDIGRYHASLGDNRQALLYLLRSLRIHQELGDRFGERGALEAIGGVYHAQGNFAKAVMYAEQALAIAEAVEDRRGIIAALVRAADAESRRGEHARALTLLERALRLTREGGYADDMLMVMRALARACEGAGETARSRRYQRFHEEYARTIFNAEQTHRTRQLIAGFERKVIRDKAESLGLTEEDLAALNELDGGVLQGGKEGDASEGDAVASSTVHAPSIVVRTFGELRVRVDGRPLGTADWGRKKARDLFKFLLIHHRRAVTMEEIIEKLWEGAAGRSTELLVMNAVSRIRRALEPGRSPRDRNSMLSSSDGTYRLDLGDDADIDFMRFKELIVLARRAQGAAERYAEYEQAVALFTDDFLKEDYYEEWTISERELLKDAFLEALEYIAGEQLREERCEEAGERARRILTFDSTSERGYEVLLESLVARGRHAEALQVLDECRSAFRRELGVDPPESMRRIVERALPLAAPA